ncbi:MAG: transposase [Thermodesulfovibrionales bacterium]|nr:transposase [Thermodesulfovibrionales bacterium]
MGTIDRYGLKRRYFNKHKKMVKHFFDHLQNYGYKSELAIQYQKKFKKNKDKLFTFLDYDSIPWNNNNAEHAIKHLARYRRNVDGLFSEKGVKEYLILLSIYQTCKYKGLNFLKFLMSEEKSIFSHFEKYYRIRKSSH